MVDKNVKKKVTLVHCHWECKLVAATMKNYMISQKN